jgi:hypothetical protein
VRMPPLEPLLGQMAVLPTGCSIVQSQQQDAGSQFLFILDFNRSHSRGCEVDSLIFIVKTPTFLTSTGPQPSLKHPWCFFRVLGVSHVFLISFSSLVPLWVCCAMGSEEWGPCGPAGHRSQGGRSSHFEEPGSTLGEEPALHYPEPQRPWQDACSH